jgi:hypothetical protein
MVRPANLLTLIAWSCGFILVLFLIRGKAINRTLVLVGYLLVFIGSAAVAWIPQYLHNLSLNSGGIFPIMPIFDIQVRVGVILLKYSSIVLKEYAEGLLFPNPWCIDPIPTQAWLWYFEHPFRGAATIAGHLFSAFNFEYPFVYVYDLDPPYSIPVAWAMWMVIAIGLLQGIRAVRLLGKTVKLEYIPTVTMVGGLFVMTTGLNAFVAVENRFNVIPVAILSVLAVSFILSYRTEPRVVKVAVPILALFVSTVGAILSEKARGSAIRPTAPIDTFRCLPEAETLSLLLDRGGVTPWIGP